MERLGFRDQTGLLGRGGLCIPEVGGPVRQEVVTGKVLGDLGLLETWLHSATAVPLPTAFPCLALFLLVPLKGTRVSASGPLRVFPSVAPPLPSSLLPLLS